MPLHTEGGGTDFWLDEGDDATLGDDDVAEELVELLVIADGELEVAWHNVLFLVVVHSIAGKFKDFGGEVD